MREQHEDNGDATEPIKGRTMTKRKGAVVAVMPGILQALLPARVLLLAQSLSSTSALRRTGDQAAE